MKQTTDKKTREIVYAICVFFLGVFLTYGIIYKFPSVFQETITKIEKDVTVTDEGIADAVEKVYDKVVIISNYVDGNLYGFGSGFVYKIDGDNMYLLTNYHVISGGNSFKATFSDSDVLDATLMGGDEYSDLAVLKVKTKSNIKAVETSSSTSLRVGDTTFTVGAPLDNVYSWTVTRGIISGKERLVEITVGNSYENNYIMNVLQTDAAVNSGNSGGPLCNSNGDVIGVISAKIKSTGVEGMGFAIPIETAQEKAEQIINGKESDYPYLGISMINLSNIKMYPGYYQYLENNNDLTDGVMVADVESKSSASKAGLKKGDIITKINDTNISNIAYLRYELYKHNVGDTIKITIIRDGKTSSIDLKLAAGGSSI